MKDADAEDHVRTVYAQFGLALYLAQVLEHGLANALVLAELIPRRAGKPIPRNEWEAEFNAFLGQQFEQTLGRLIQGLKRATAVPADLKGLLARALQTRNFLSHHFFRERAEAFMSREGREEMLEELGRAQKLFEAADARLTEVVKPLGEKYGLTEERMRPIEEAYLAKIKHDL
jgi:hypothetical protein